MANWRLAKSLIQLRDQLNKAYPNRSRVSDGTIGDPAHAARGKASDHNPNADGVVAAFDATHDPASGLHGLALAESATNDPRTKYVIFAGRIWKARTGIWENYTGPNRHTQHVHISVKQESADDESPWVLNGESKPTRPTLKRPAKGPEVAELQRQLGMEKVDSIFGRDTELAVREFQAHHGLQVDGVAGPRTNAILFGG